MFCKMVISLLALFVFTKCSFRLISHPCEYESFEYKTPEGPSSFEQIGVMKPIEGAVTVSSVPLNVPLVMPVTSVSSQSSDFSQEQAFQMMCYTQFANSHSFSS